MRKFVSRGATAFLTSFCRDITLSDFRAITDSFRRFQVNIALPDPKGFLSAFPEKKVCQAVKVNNWRDYLGKKVNLFEVVHIYDTGENTRDGRTGPLTATNRLGIPLWYRAGSMGILARTGDLGRYMMQRIDPQQLLKTGGKTHLFFETLLGDDQHPEYSKIDPMDAVIYREDRKPLPIFHVVAISAFIESLMRKTGFMDTKEDDEWNPSAYWDLNCEANFRKFWDDFVDRTYAKRPYRRRPVSPFDI